MNELLNPETVSLRESMVIPKFRPCAFFDERLDCIRVITRDCSTLEERVNARVTVLVEIHSGPTRKYAGFTIKGARHFCKQHNWNLAASIKMSEVLDGLLSSFPEMLIEWFVQVVAKPLVKEENIEQVEPDLVAIAA